MISDENRNAVTGGARLVIFDFDGVIMDSERLHYSKFNEVLNEEGENLTWDEYMKNYLALNDRDCFTAVLLDHGWKWAVDSRNAGPAWGLISDDYIESLIERKLFVFMRDLASGLKPVPGTFEFIRRASVKYPLAIASGALRPEIEQILAQYEMRDYFDVIVGAEDVAHGKPDPESFLKALTTVNTARCASIDAADCIVIEDSIHGVEAAKTAGMRCIALTTTYPAQMLGHADLIVGTLDDVVL